MACKFLYQGVWHSEAELKKVYENSTGPQVTIIKDAIRNSLPIEVSNTITVLNNVPIDVLGRNDLFLSIKELLNDKGINDELLINWAGINKDKVNPKGIKSEDHLLNTIKTILKNKQKESIYVEFKTNPLALESFRKWNQALEKYPEVFQEVMLSHAVKWMLNPVRRQKYVLQLSEVSLANAYGIVVNKPHELNRIGKLYDLEVLKTVSDAVGHEPSESGNGYWVHVPMTPSGKHLGYDTYEQFLDIIKKVEDDIKNAQEIKNKVPVFNTQEPSLDREDANKYGFQEFTFIRVESSHGRKYSNPFPEFLGEGYQGYYIHGYNTERDKPHTRVIPITKKEAEELWKKQVERIPDEAYEVDDRQNLYRLKDNIRRLENLKHTFNTVKPEDWNVDSTQFKVNVELLKKLSPSTWCTASGQADHYVANYDNYLLIVNGITMVGIEAYPKKEYASKIQVKEVTSRANNGTASVDHLDDTLAFFEKHNLDPNIPSLKNAIRAKNNGKKDVNQYSDEEANDDFWDERDREERWAIDEHNGEHEYDPPEDYYDPEEELHDQELIAAINTPELALQEIEGNGLPVLRLFRYLRQELKNNETIANKAIDYDAHNITQISTTVPFYNELVIKAVTKSPNVFEYLLDDVKDITGLREIYDEWHQNRLNQDDLPFSKTSSNQVQGYYDARNDKVVVIASNTPVNEAPKVGIHEVAHRGMIRMAEDLGGIRELNKVLLNSEKELMKKLPELLERTGHKNVENLMMDYGFDVNTEEGKSKLLMELAARWAETFANKPKSSWWKEFLTSIKNWISKFTGHVLNEEEVNELVGGFVRYGSKETTNKQIIDANKPEDNTTFKNELLKYLQGRDIIATKEFPAGSGNFYIKKTYKGQDKHLYNPEETERRNVEKIVEINQSLGFEAISTVKIGGGLVVKINSQLSIFDRFSEEDLNQPQVTIGDEEYFNQNILTDNARDLVDNIYRVGLMFNKTDMVNIGNILKSKEDLLAGVNIIIDPGEHPEGPANYQADSNTIVLYQGALSKYPVESSVRVIMEEFLHALTVVPFYKQELGFALKPDEKRFVDDITKLYDYYKTHAPAYLKEAYRFKNRREFIIGMTLDSQFKEHIAEVDKPGFFEKMITDFINAILRFFNIKTQEDVYPFEALTVQYINRYMSTVDRVQPLIVDNDTHELISGAPKKDLRSEKEALKGSLTQAQKDKLKEKVKIFINQIKSIGNTRRSSNDDIKNILAHIRRDYSKFNEDDIDQIDFFFNFTRELNSIFDSLNRQIITLETNKILSDNDKLFRWNRIMQTARDYDSTLNEFKKISADFFTDELIAKHIDDIVTKRSKIEEKYFLSITPLVVTNLSNIIQPATDKALAYLDDEIAILQSRVKLATDSGAVKRAKDLQQKVDAKIKERNEKYNVTVDKVQDYLRGILGDSNTLSSYLEAGIVSGNPIVAGVVKNIKDSLHKSDPEILRTANEIDSEMAIYEKESGISRNDLEAFNRPLLDTYKVIDDMDDEGNYIMRDVLSLLTPYNMDYVRKLQEFTYTHNKLDTEYKKATTEAERIRIKTEKKKNTNNRLQFLRDYMEMPYLNEVHVAQDLIHEDLGGFTAYEAIGALYDEKDQLEKDIESTKDEDVKEFLYNKLDDVEFRIKEIRTTYEKDPESKEYKIAAQLNKRDEALKKYRKFVLTRAGEAKFNLEKDRTDTLFADGEITQKDRDQWYQRNTVTALSEDYWKTKLGIIDRMNDLLKQMAASQEKNEDLTRLYKERENIVKPYRDSNGVIQGSKFNDKQVSDIKELEEDIEELKNSLDNLFGLSKNERIEVANLNEEFENNDIEMQSSYDQARLDFLKNEQIRIEKRIDEINDKKKKFSKKLLNKYFALMKELSELDIASETHYYTERYEQEFDKHVANQSVKDMDDKFVNERIVYEKISGTWYARTKSKSTKLTQAEAEKVYRTKKAEETFDQTEWYRNNHILRMEWVKHEQDYEFYEAFGPSGTWNEVYKPLYIWMETNPTNPKHKVAEQPALQYKTAIIKNGKDDDGKRDGSPDYTNPNYKLAINGHNVPKLIGAKDNTYINKRYFELAGATDNVNKARFRYLNYHTKLYEKSQIESYIPKTMRPGTDMPSIRPSSTERMIGTSASEKVSLVGQWLRGVQDEVVGNEQDKDILYGYMDNKGMIPMKFLGKIDIKDQTIDIARANGMFHIAAQQRMRLGETWALTTATIDILSEKENTPTKLDKDGKVKTIAKKYLNKNTRVAQHIAGTSNTLRQVNEIMNTFYFGEKIKDEAGAKQLNKVLGIGANLMLGLNFGSMIQNWSNAKIQTILEGESKLTKNFTIKDWVKAESTYWAHIGELMADLGKYGNKSYINQFVDYFGGINFNITSSFDSTSAYKALTKGVGKVLMPTEMAEHQLSYVLFMSIAINTKVKMNGEDVSLFDAFKLGDNGLEMKDGVVLSQEERDDFINKINSSARRINGEYGNLDSPLAQKFVIGRLYLFMNKYFTPFLMRRFGKRRFNIQDGIQDDGFWRLFFRTLYTDVKAFQLNVVKNWKYYTPSERAAIKQVGTEVSISLIIMSMIAMLGGDDDKELKDNGIIANNIIYVLKGIKRQNEQFMLVPGLGLDDVYNRIRNPFPIMTKVGQAFSVLNDAVYLAGYEMGYNDLKDIEYTKKSGWHVKGDLKIWADLGKLFSLPNKFHQLTHPDVAIKNLDAYRIK